MAISKNNPLTHGASGMFGGVVVFKTWNGNTYMSSPPKKPTKESASQKENRSRFKMATAYAHRMMKDPVMKAEYMEKAHQMKLPNAYTAAITEYMRKPEIREIDTSNYSGKENQEISLNVSKKGFEVAKVEVIIVDNDGGIIEEGKAVKDISDTWTYKTMTSMDNISFYRVLVKAKDRTGNVIGKEMVNQLE